MSREVKISQDKQSKIKIKTCVFYRQKKIKFDF